MLMKAVTARTFGRLSAANAVAASAKTRTAFRMGLVIPCPPAASALRPLLQSRFREGPAARAPGCHRHGSPGRPLRALPFRRTDRRRGVVDRARARRTVAALATSRGDLLRARVLLYRRAHLR